MRKNDIVEKISGAIFRSPLVLKLSDRILVSFLRLPAFEPEIFLISLLLISKFSIVPGSPSGISVSRLPPSLKRRMKHERAL